MVIVNYLFDRHRFITSFILSLSLFLYLLFQTDSLQDQYFSENTNPLEVVQIETMEQAAHVYRKELTTDKTSDTTKEVTKARGTSTSEDAIDLAFMPNIAPPRPIGRLKKDYPQLAKQEDVEATVFTEVLILANGKVNNVKIIGIRLSKSFPDDKKKRMRAAFTKSTKKILFSTRFSSTIIDGKKVPIRIEFPLKFNLSDIR